MPVAETKFSPELRGQLQMSEGDTDTATESEAPKQTQQRRRGGRRPRPKATEQLAQVKQAREAVQKEEEAKAKQMPPAVIDGKTINVNEGSKTENNVSAQPSMRPSGSTGELAMGAGSMTGGAYL